MTVILAPLDPEPKTKSRAIDLFKSDIYKSIEGITQKHTDAMGDSVDVKVRDSVAADPAEDLDGIVLAEHVAIREATLRKRLQRVLEDEEVESANNRLDAQDNTFHYALVLPEVIKDTILKPLARYMHRYIVYGVLFDWYSELGLTQQASVYERQVTLMEQEIAGALKGPSITKKPLQPFGPAGKYPPII